MLFPLLTLLIVLYAFNAAADEINCGEMPLIADEGLKAEIQGKAKLLSRFLGDASLSGQIETSRKDIFAKYPNAQQSRTLTALEYQMCEYLKQDKTHSPFEKFKILKLDPQVFSGGQCGDISHDFVCSILQRRGRCKAPQLTLDHMFFGTVEGEHLV